jgi:hypothetical protein
VIPNRYCRIAWCYYLRTEPISILERNDGRSALLWSIQLVCPYVAEILLLHGANPNDVIEDSPYGGESARITGAGEISATGSRGGPTRIARGTWRLSMQVGRGIGLNK